MPKGWRQARTADAPDTQSDELHTRLREHSRSVKAGFGLDLTDFMCRFVIFEEAASDMIGTIEAALIKLHRPLWNTALDGFGNHDPGSGRYNQAKSDWDVVHDGRSWASRCQGIAKDKAMILRNIENHLRSIGAQA